jgi:hypothetical protein
VGPREQDFIRGSERDESRCPAVPAYQTS